MAKGTKEIGPKLITPDFRHEYKNENYGFECKLRPLAAKDFAIFANLMGMQQKIGQISPKETDKTLELFQDFDENDTKRVIKIVAASMTEWNLKELAVSEENIKEYLSPMLLLLIFVEVINLNFR